MAMAYGGVTGVTSRRDSWQRAFYGLFDAHGPRGCNVAPRCNAVPCYKLSHRSILCDHAVASVSVPLCCWSGRASASPADASAADDGRRIERTFRFGNFRESLTFVQQVGELAEAEGHHPDNLNRDGHTKRVRPSYGKRINVIPRTRLR
jgi:hypothetical protein